MTIDNVQALPLGTRLGDYRLDAVIGHGGFGITYRAFDSQLAKIVAIKEYLPVEFAVRLASGNVVPRAHRLAEDFTWGRERFLDEARALARFRHPHIVPVLRYFEANGTAYTVMEFEDGRSVGQLLHERGKRLPPPEVLSLATGLLNGLAAVHAQGFLHRDIKPSKIMVRTDGVPVLIDFGAARQAMGGRTQTLTGILTPQYAPIEQYVLDSKQGPWSDIYSAAAVLHHAIAGHPPPEAAARVGSADPYRPLAVTHADRFDQAFLSAIDHALAFLPEQRPQSVEAWNALFDVPPLQSDQQLTQRLPIQAAPPSSTMAPRGLSGVSREQALMQPAEPPAVRRAGGRVVFLIVLAALAVAGWRYQSEIRTQWAAHVQPRLAAWLPPTNTAQVDLAQPTTETPAPPIGATPSTASLALPPPTTTPTTPPAPETAAQKALIEQATRAANEAKAVLEKAEEAAVSARAMAGEARIAAARAARPDLEGTFRVTYDDGATYVGQSKDGKRLGFGVADLKEGERQAGQWKDDLLDGLGLVRFANDLRYTGQWAAGQSTGAGVREKPGVERAEGNFVDGRLEGPALRRTLGEPNVVQAGSWHADALEGPGIESVGDRERYEGTFRNGRRHGFGILTGSDGVGRAGHWDDGKLVTSAP